MLRVATWIITYQPEPLCDIIMNTGYSHQCYDVTSVLLLEYDGQIKLVTTVHHLNCKASISYNV